MNTSRYYHNRSSKPPVTARLLLYTTLFLFIALRTETSAASDERLAVLPFEIVDNTPVPGGNNRNEQMLDKLTHFIAEQIGQAGIFQVTPQSEVNDAVRTAQLGTYIHTCNDCEFDIARQIEADKVLVGWIYKMSILVLTMHIEIKDVTSQKTIISKAYDFRGDNEKAWLRAAKYMVRDLEERLGKGSPAE